jgi:flagellar export protein FliJ
MAFHFTLEAALRYRQSLEEREQLRLESLLARRAALLQELQRADEARLQVQKAMRQVLQTAAAAAELQFCALQLNGIARQQNVLRSQLLQLEREVDEQTARYRQERQKREVLQSLRDVQLQEYRLVQQRRQQAMLDELYLLRRARRDLPSE